MTAKPLTKQDLDHLIWLCRRLANALQAGATIAPALDQVAEHAPPGVKPLLTALRKTVASGRPVSDGLAAHGVPEFVRAAVYRGECAAALDRALLRLADELDWERGLDAACRKPLCSYALAFARLGMMLEICVPVLAALDAAAAVTDAPELRDALLAAHRAIARGGALSDALERAPLDLPAMTIDMIRDGENDNRLGQALTVVADYLLDEAGQPPRRRSQSVCEKPAK